MLKLQYCIVFLLFSCPLLAQSYSSEVENRIRQVESNLASWVEIEGQPRWTLEERLRHYKVPGISIAVIRDYKIEWARGYGWADVEEKRRVTPQTLFQAASISKSLNGVAILKLVERQQLKLDEDINTYLKTWHPSADSGKITLNHLLSHTAGLTIHGFPGYEVTDTLPTVEQILRGEKPANTKEVKPAFTSGKRMQYSGGGTTISQLILTGVTGEKYDVFLQREVLDPLGMTGSFFTQPAPQSKKNLLATGHHRNGEPVKGKYHVYPEMAAAGLWTTPTDLAKYIIETQLSYAGQSSKVLSPAMTKTRLTPYINPSSALGVFIRKEKEHTYFSHNGGNEGFTSTYLGSLDGGNGYVIMVNSDNFDVANEVVRSIGLTYGWKDFHQTQKIKTVTVPADTLRQYAGTYKLGNTTVVATFANNELRISIDGGEPLLAHFSSVNEFFFVEFPPLVKFEKGAKGFDIVAGADRFVKQ
ncbi:serine hydrolase domain-containing protein [Chitinophaga cymbidii]|uniref:Beta-lactamase-related domain-containing protein n=1 Tax=Chitinophaga cymbidii TaxID=1096750 RepID=A0A512REJ4_9BACT|nr:serine hydrolase domain-containing protein [Chitinophaga cymbidii]GEP94112.1 hypothetical protein CCY01nite_03720 [Chitinophaga cymbidii]